MCGTDAGGLCAGRVGAEWGAQGPRGHPQGRQVSDADT